MAPPLFWLLRPKTLESFLAPFSYLFHVPHGIYVKKTRLSPSTANAWPELREVLGWLDSHISLQTGLFHPCPPAVNFSTAARGLPRKCPLLKTPHDAPPFWEVKVHFKALSVAHGALYNLPHTHSALHSPMSSSAHSLLHCSGHTSPCGHTVATGLWLYSAWNALPPKSFKVDSCSSVLFSMRPTFTSPWNVASVLACLLRHHHPPLLKVRQETLLQPIYRWFLNALISLPTRTDFDLGLRAMNPSAYS